MIRGEVLQREDDRIVSMIPDAGCPSLGQLWWRCDRLKQILFVRKMQTSSNLCLSGQKLTVMAYDPLYINRRKNYAKILDRAIPSAAFSKILCGKNKTFLYSDILLGQIFSCWRPLSLNNYCIPWNRITRWISTMIIIVLEKWSVLAAVENGRVF